MCEVDERRIKELAKLPPRVLLGTDRSAARKEARKVVESLGLIRAEGQGSGRREGENG
ncbi:hypothetical protein [Streptomyces sp. NPDC006140]|uniref:hypothetical protein n=1 Tax=Streptomyces sp. NPDC006140 TaxID=3154579 RepID=UPI0034034DB4